jgi:hypothetical protein
VREEAFPAPVRVEFIFWVKNVVHEVCNRYIIGLHLVEEPVKHLGASKQQGTRFLLQSCLLQLSINSLGLAQ